MVDHSDKVSNVLLHSEGTFQVRAPTVAAQVGYDNCVATGESIDNWVENLSRSHEAVDEEQRLTPAHLFVEDRSSREVSCDHRAPILTPSLGRWRTDELRNLQVERADLPRTHLPRCWVNKDKKKGRSVR